MRKRSLIEQLDNAVQGLLTKPDSTPEVDASLEPLVQIAAQLRDLPRAEFKKSLELKLLPQNAAENKESPGGFYAVIPVLVFSNASEAIEFYKRAFGAEERFRLNEPDGRVGHAEIVIGNSTIKVSDEFPNYGALSPASIGGSPVKLHLSVTDVDAVAARAVQAGATVVRPVQDQFYGDRTGHFADPFGYTWILSTRKEELRPEEIQRRYNEMFAQESSAEKKVTPIPEGFRTITPYIVVAAAAELIEFVKQAFGGVERFRSIGPAGGIHCEMKIGDSIVLIGGGGKWKGTPKPTAIHLYVPNADEVYAQALQAGATSLSEPRDQPYGDREAGVRDLGGNFWYIATNKETGGAPEGLTAVTPFLHPRQPGEVIDFLKRGLGAQEMSVAQTPRGIIQHATMKLGNSVVELGPAHGAYQAMPTMFYMYVENVETVDALYRRALEAGGTSMSPPADQPYGDRNAGVIDPFGNEWYIATHVKDV